MKPPRNDRRSRLSGGEPKEPADGLALCLSGGGYRAILYHVSALLRLNEFGLLSNVSRVSSVSGGSITAGVLALHWPNLTWSGDKATNLETQLVAPIREMARQTVDVASIGWGILNPFKSVSDEVADAYAKHLFGTKTLQDLKPASEDSDATSPRTPRFVFNATNVKTGSLWRFSQNYMGDWRVGLVNAPTVSLARVVAASSAFPPFLSPMRMDLREFVFDAKTIPDKSDPSLRTEAVLTDGGVYDNLGLETAWKRYKTIFVSDGGRPTADDLQPANDWARHARRLIDMLERQVSALRARQLMAAITDDRDVHKGAYWGIGTDPKKYKVSSPNLDCSTDAAWAVAAIDTRLAALSEKDQQRIINWGYASCDLSMRANVKRFADTLQGKWPYDGGLV